MQAVLSGFIGYVLGIALALTAIGAARDTKLTVIMTPELAGGLFAVTIAMCVFAAIGAIIKVVRIDPAVVFSR
jgi:putative ABC transport system permease protein